MHGWKTIALVPAMVAALVLSGCGDRTRDDRQAETAPAVESPEAADPSVPPPMQAFSDTGGVAEITIEGNDMMQFDIDRFSVRPGQMVRLTLKHVGTLPAQAMGHNVVILWPDDDVFEFGADVGQHRGGLHDDYVPETLRSRVVAFTALIGGGETAVVEFQTPDAAGQYPFLCSFPGHFAQMNGTMLVAE